MNRRPHIGSILRAGLASLKDWRRSIRLIGILCLVYAAFAGLDQFVERATWLLLFAMEAAYLAGALLWQRHLLLGTEPRWAVETNPAAREPFGSVALPYLWRVVGFWLLVLGPSTVAASIGLDERDDLAMIAALFAPVLLLLAVSRFLLVLPACATGDRLGLLEAWRLGQGTGLRLALVLLMQTALFFAPLLLHFAVMPEAFQDSVEGSLIGHALTSVGRALAVLSGAASIAFVWRELTVSPVDVSVFD